MPETLKKISKSGSNKKESYYDPPYNIKYCANGLWKNNNSVEKNKNDPYYDPKYKGAYYGNGLYSPDPDEAEKNWNKSNTPILYMILVLLCASPFR